MMKMLCTAICMLLAITAFAQDKSNQELSFVYISHDENTDTKALVSRLKEKYASVINYPDNRACVFYLANGTDPIIVKLNMPGDNREVFEEVIYSLQNKLSHDVSATSDVDNIVDIINENDILDEDGKPLYRHIEWDYYINSTFWQLRNNEHLIAKLYFVLDMESLMSTYYLTLNFYYGRETDVIQYDLEKPFGNKEICRSLQFVPMPY